MKKIVRLAMFASLFAALMLACTPKENTDPIDNGEEQNDGKDDGGTDLIGGEYDKNEEKPGHVDIDPGTDGDDEKAKEIEDDIKGDLGDGGIDDMVLGDNNTWSMKVKPSALIPGAIPDKYKANEEFVHIPFDFEADGADPADFKYEIYEADSYIMLKMPRDVGETILRRMLPDDFDYLFDDPEGQKILKKFNKGLFRIDDKEGYISLNYMYRKNGTETLLYVDKTMMLGTLTPILELMNNIPGEDDIRTTVEFDEILLHMQERALFIQGCDTFEVGTNFQLNLGGK